MPTLSRYFIKTALIYFVLALLVGLLLSAPQVFGLPASVAAVRPTYLHLLVVGWLTQLIFGVVYWMFPKFSKENPRGNEKVAWGVYVLLNVGLIFRAIGEPLMVLQPQANAGWMVVLSAILQFAAGWAFIFNTWPRVKER